MRGLLRPRDGPSLFRARRLAGWLAHGLLELAAPRRCGACQRACEQTLCGACRLLVTWDRRPDASVPHLDACVAAVAYGGVVADWLQRFKYPRSGLTALDPAPIGVLQALVAEAAAHAPGPAPDLVVPVPLHPRRLRGRGFNPAMLLARHVARTSGVRCAAGRLQRSRDTPSQTGLGRQGRRRNVAGAFSCRGSVPPRIWLVDDVVTTGATLSECARVLRRAGARRIVAICAARTPHEGRTESGARPRAEAKPDEPPDERPDERPEQRGSWARPMPRIKQAATLLHRPNLGEEATGVHFEVGDALEILEEWESHYLCRRSDDPDGRLFNIRKDLVDPS